MIQFPKINGEFQKGEGTFSLPRELRADLGAFAPWCLEVFCQRLALVDQPGDPWLRLYRDGSLPEEGYLLKISPGGIEITAGDERGVIWALTTVYLRLQRDRRVDCCVVRDAPRWSHRGQSMDCVRHFFPVEEVERLLEQMSLVKMNVLHFHLTDDQGWRIESLQYPQLHRVNDRYYTQAQLRHLVKYARVRGIEIIPEVDLPGHTTAMLAAYPHLGCTGKRPQLATAGGIYTTILCAGNEEVYAFLEGMLGEICAIFPGERFHIGGDEAPKAQWAACPACQAAAKAYGCENLEQLQGQFTRRVIDILRKHGKTPICWNETLKGYPDPEDIQIQYWSMDGMDNMDAYAKAGGKYFYSYMCELYLDYPYSMTSVRKLYRLRPHIWTRRCGKDKGMLGIESTLWAEHIADPVNLQEHLYPRMYIVAEKAWSGGHENYASFLKSLRSLCDLARQAGISPMAESWWNPRGIRRREEALDFFIKMNGGVLEEEMPENQAPAQTNLRLMADYVLRFFRLCDLPSLYKIYFR